MKKITSENLRQSFNNVTNSSVYKDFLRKSHVLENRFFGEKHFNQVEEALDYMAKKLPLVTVFDLTSSISSDRGRNLVAFLCYLITDKYENEHFRPRYDKLYMKKDFFGFYSVELPLSFNYRHVGSRYESYIEMEKEFDINQFSVQFLYAFSVVLSKVMNEYMAEKNRDSSAIVIPEGRGLYLGRAFKVGHNHLNNHTDISRRGKNGGFVRYNKEEAWKPLVDNQIYTLLDYDRMRPSQKELNDLLDKYHKDDDLLNPIIDFAQSYFWCDDFPINTSRKKAIDYMLDSLRSDIRSELWHEMEISGDNSYLKRMKKHGREPIL